MKTEGSSCFDTNCTCLHYCNCCHTEFASKYDDLCNKIIVDATTHLRQSNIVVDHKSENATAYAILLDFFMPAIKSTTQWNKFRRGCVHGLNFIFENSKVTLSDEGISVVVHRQLFTCVESCLATT